MIQHSNSGGAATASRQHGRCAETSTQSPGGGWTCFEGWRTSNVIHAGKTARPKLKGFVCGCKCDNMPLAWNRGA